MVSQLRRAEDRHNSSNEPRAGDSRETSTACHPTSTAGPRPIAKGYPEVVILERQFAGPCLAPYLVTGRLQSNMMRRAIALGGAEKDLDQPCPLAYAEMV